MSSKGIQVCAFDRNAVTALLGGTCPGQYVAEYVERLHAAVVVVESHYVDRHFLDEFSHYYSKSFTPPDSHCERLHFFRSLSVDRFETLRATCAASGTGHHDAEAELQKSYLGFVVRRPLPSARIGRTVLVPYPPDDARRYEVIRPYKVHLLTFTLRVDGLAFQQQDRGAAVCASTALWSALQRVAQMAGNRTPTPTTVTKAAASPFPASSGLDLRQMATALATLGYSADFFAPEANRPAFRAKLIAYLQSTLPVVLLVERTLATQLGKVKSGHAVTVTGYRGPLTPVDVLTTPTATSPLRMPGGSARVVYVHDDNLGSHAKYELVDSNEVDELGNRKLVLRRGTLEAKTIAVMLSSASKGWLTGVAGEPATRPHAAFTATKFTQIRSVRIVTTMPLQRDVDLRISLQLSDALEDRWGPTGNAITKVLKQGGSSESIGPFSLRGGQQVAFRVESPPSVPLRGHIEMLCGPSMPGWDIDDWTVFGALVPKPDKVRLPIEDLFLSLHDVRRLLATKVFDGLEIAYEVRIRPGIDYRDDVLTRPVDQSELRQFIEDRVLPRHVGVVSLADGGNHLCDLVLDVTEVSRDPRRPPGLAIIAWGMERGSAAHRNLIAVADRLGWTLVGPQQSPSAASSSQPA